MCMTRNHPVSRVAVPALSSVTALKREKKKKRSAEGVLNKRPSCQEGLDKEEKGSNSQGKGMWEEKSSKEGAHGTTHHYELDIEERRTPHKGIGRRGEESAHHLRDTNIGKEKTTRKKTLQRAALSCNGGHPLLSTSGEDPVSGFANELLLGGRREESTGILSCLRKSRSGKDFRWARGGCSRRRLGAGSSMGLRIKY